MTDFGKPLAKNQLQTKAVAETPVVPKSRLRLGTIVECRLELAKIYRQAKTRRLKLEDATRLAFILTSIANMIRNSEIEERIEALEKLR